MDPFVSLASPSSMPIVPSYVVSPFCDYTPVSVEEEEDVEWIILPAISRASSCGQTKDCL